MEARRDLSSVNFTYTLYNYNRQPAGSTRCDRRLRVRLIDLPPWKNTHSRSRPSSPHPQLWFSFGLCNVTTFDPIERASHPPGNPFTTPWRTTFYPDKPHVYPSSSPNALYWCLAFWRAVSGVVYGVRTHTNDELHSKTPCPFSARPIVSRLTQINFCRFQTTDQFRLFVFVLFIKFFFLPPAQCATYLYINDAPDDPSGRVP